MRPFSHSPGFWSQGRVELRYELWQPVEMAVWRIAGLWIMWRRKRKGLS